MERKANKNQQIFQKTLNSPGF